MITVTGATGKLGERGTGSGRPPLADTPVSTDDPHDVQQTDHHHRRWAVLSVLAVAQLMVVLDATIVNIALPSAQAALGFDDPDRQWVITAYALAFGGLLLLGGRLADLFGRRNMLIIGLVGFALTSAAGGAAGSIGLLVAARAGQGVFGALLAPAALSLLTVTFTDPGERGKAFGIFGAVSGAGAAVGLLLGGVLTEYLDWRWCLYVNVPIAVAAVIGALALIPRGADAAGSRLDAPGTVTVVLGLASLVYGFSRAEADGWLAGSTLGFIAAGLVLLGVFVLLQRRVADPLMPLRVVLDRWRGGAYLAISLATIGMFAVFLFLTFYLQRTLDFSPLRTAVAFLPLVVGIMLSSTAVVPPLLERIGPKPLILTGQVLGAASLAWLSMLAVGSSYTTHVLPPLVVMGLGVGLIFGSCFNTATAGAARRDSGVASALVNTGQQVGGAIGTALLTTLAATATADLLAKASGRPSAALIAQAAVAGETRAFLVASGIFVLSALVTMVVLPWGMPTAGRPAPELAEGVSGGDTVAVIAD